MRAPPIAVVGFVGVTIVTLAPSFARADDEPDPVDFSAGVTPPASPLQQEVIGLEATPVVAYFSAWTHGLTIAPGATVRLGRHRWSNQYWTPIMLGFFRNDGDHWIIALHAMTEYGGVMHVGRVAIEAGAAAGAGALRIDQPGLICDGCGAGGVGVFVSPVIRVLFRESAPMTVGVVGRALLPVVSAVSRWGTVVMLGVEIATGFN